MEGSQTVTMTDLSGRRRVKELLTRMRKYLSALHAHMYKRLVDQNSHTHSPVSHTHRCSMQRLAILSFFLFLLSLVVQRSLPATLPIHENSLPAPLNGQLIKLNMCLDSCEEKWKSHPSHERKILTAKCWDNCFHHYAGDQLHNYVTVGQE